jgi:hypothetical protein
MSSKDSSTKTVFLLGAVVAAASVVYLLSPRKQEQPTETEDSRSEGRLKEDNEVHDKISYVAGAAHMEASLSAREEYELLIAEIDASHPNSPNHQKFGSRRSFAASFDRHQDCNVSSPIDGGSVSESSFGEKQEEENRAAVEGIKISVENAKKRITEVKDRARSVREEMEEYDVEGIKISAENAKKRITEVKDRARSVREEMEEYDKAAHENKEKLSGIDFSPESKKGVTMSPVLRFTNAQGRESPPQTTLSSASIAKRIASRRLRTMLAENVHFYQYYCFMQFSCNDICFYSARCCWESDQCYNQSSLRLCISSLLEVYKE